MFDKLTPAELRKLTELMTQAAGNVITEVVSAVRLGRAAYDFAYGDGAAMRYARTAQDLVDTLAILASTTPAPTS